MWPTTWRGADNVRGLLFGRFGNLDRSFIRRLDGDDAVAAGVEADLFRSAAG